MRRLSVADALAIPIGLREAIAAPPLPLILVGFLLVASIPSSCIGPMHPAPRAPTPLPTSSEVPRDVTSPSISTSRMSPLIGPLGTGVLTRVLLRGALSQAEPRADITVVVMRRLPREVESLPPPDGIDGSRGVGPGIPARQPSPPLVIGEEEAVRHAGAATASDGIVSVRPIAIETPLLPGLVTPIAAVVADRPLRLLTSTVIAAIAGGLVSSAGVAAARRDSRQTVARASVSGMPGARILARPVTPEMRTSGLVKVLLVVAPVKEETLVGRQGQIPGLVRRTPLVRIRSREA